MDAVNAIMPHLAPTMLIVLRVGGLALFAPLFASSAIPVRIRILLVFAVALAVYPALLGHSPLPDGSVILDPAGLAVAAAVEVLIGAFIGFVGAIPLMAAQAGGHFAGQQMGLGFAQFFDPTIEDDSDVLGQLFYLFTLALFLVLGGHEILLAIVLESFANIPPGSALDGGRLVETACAVLLAAFEIALRVSAPVLAIVLLESVALGFIAKTVPQLNILSLGFPIRIIAGWAILVIGLLVIREVFIDGIDGGIAAIARWSGVPAYAG